MRQKVFASVIGWYLDAQEVPVAQSLLQLLKRRMIGFAGGLQVREQVEDLFFVERVQQGCGHDGDGGGTSGLDFLLDELLLLIGGGAGLYGDGLLVFYDDVSDDNDARLHLKQVLLILGFHIERWFQDFSQQDLCVSFVLLHDVGQIRADGQAGAV